MPDGERTEAPTPHRRQEARQKGKVAKSIELDTVFVLFGGFLALRYLSAYIFDHLEFIMRYSFSNMAKLNFTPENLPKYSMDFLLNLGFMTLPFMLIVAVVAIAANLLQVGFLHSWQIVKPQLSRLNPVQGIKRFFSYRVLIDLLKSSLKIAATAAVVYITIRGVLEQIMMAVDMSPLQSVNMAAALVFRLGLRIVMVLAGLALLDYLYARWEYEKSLRMTRQELKEELIRYEGRPEVKTRVRAMQRQLAMRRMMQEVPKADVVVTNPTSLAVAIKYDPKEMVSPKVVAKGARLIAQKIIQVAKENNVPVTENKSLAQLLFKTVEIGQMIPMVLYQAMADILAYVWRTGKLKRKWF